MELADKMSFPSMAVTVDVNVVFFSSIAIKKTKIDSVFLFKQISVTSLVCNRSFDK